MAVGELEGARILVGVTSAQTCLILGSRLEALVAGGFQVALLSGPGSMARHGNRISEVSAHEIAMARSISPVSDFVSFIRIIGLLLRIRPQIVEFSTPKAGLLGSLAAWICRVPVRVYFLRGLRLETASAIKRSVLLWLERVASACSNVVVVNSDSLREEASALGIAGTKKLMLLGDGSSNGVDIARFSPGTSDVREKHGIPLDAHVIGFVGRLTADKGVPELIEAFAAVLRMIPDSYLLLVGWFDAAEDALGAELRARIEGHPRIVCTGYVADTAPFYRAMDLLVLPSWREGFPNVVLEAAASRLPVVATTCTGSRDAVKQKVTGLLVQPGNPAAIADAVLRIMEDGKLRARMAHAARNWAVKHFDQDRVLAETVRFYRQLLNEQADSAPLKELSSDCSASP